MTVTPILKSLTPARLRLAILALILLGLLLIGALCVYWIVNLWQRTTPAVGLSAVFSPEGQLNIKGQVQAKGKPVEGQAQVTVERLPAGQRQTAIAVVTNGQFTLAGETAFAAFKTNDLIRVKVKVWGNSQRTPGTEEVVLNGEPPLFPRSVLSWLLAGMFLFLLTTFLWAFTGKHMPGKNRVAIILSYCIILICLGVPLLSPIIVPRIFPDLLKSMHDTPVGLLLAVDPRFQSKPESDVLKQPQWMLNIGGYVSTNLNLLQTNAPTGRELTLPADVVTVWGGLLVPLYVLILSIIGGAINMTMKLPMSQRDQESEINLNLKGFTRAIGEFVLKIRAPVEPAPAPTPPVAHPTQAGDTPAQTAAGVGSARSGQPHSSTSPGAANSTPNPTEVKQAHPTEEASPPEDPSNSSSEPGERLRRWRKELLEQYMFLISAPFLAIVTYYLLIWLDLVKVPVLVLVSFSIGLITQQILDRIIGLAQGVVARERSVQMDPHPDQPNAAGNLRNGSLTTGRAQNRAGQPVGAP